jgi:D-alanine-D-alanine ligase
MAGLTFAAIYDRRIIIEKGISAREIEVSVLGNENPEASIPGEIIPAEEFYSYDAKYLNADSELIIPARISEETIEELRLLAVEIYKSVDCAGMARVDFLFDKDSSRYYVCEINTIPGFTKISMYPKLWEASGLSYTKLIDRLIELAMERKVEKDKTERKFRSKS